MSVIECRNTISAGMYSDAAVLGPRMARTDVRSSMGPFLVFPEYKIRYPDVVVRALGTLYAEYNEAFGPLIEANREWDTDYQFCMSDGSPTNCAIQIDMVGLPHEFLSVAERMSEKAVHEVLRGGIFEMENSLAMYQLLEKIFSTPWSESFFKKQFRASLDELRRRYGKQIALLAVTEEKYAAMRETEFGKVNGGPLTDAEVLELSGFDRFFGPVEFREYLSARSGACDYLLYARTSDPVAKLKKPDVEVEHLLLGDSYLRQVVKAHALTFNIDAPGSHPYQRINDTKEYMLAMRLACSAHSLADIFTPGFYEHLSGGKPYAEYSGARLAGGFAAYAVDQGLDMRKLEAGDVMLRGKPMRGTYGCYGHVRGMLKDGKFRAELRRNMRNRGAYVVQPEMQIPVMRSGGRSYSYIDRVFFACTGGPPTFLGGFRSLMPVDSLESQKGRNHGNSETIWAEIM